jgi:PKHD-type hydroxylase
MFLEIPDVLTPAELDRLREFARTSKFVEGRISNPHNTTKNNLQLHGSDGVAKECAALVAASLGRSEEFRNFTFPVRMAPPLMCRYQPGMNYGPHSDSAFLPMQPLPLRSDIACTVFIADPAGYDGGELTIRLGTRAIEVKGKAGSAIVYPSTTIHEVRPVTRGERLVAITFVQSQIVDEKKRELLYTLNESAALEGLKMQWQNRVRLEQVRQSLHRMWSP